MSEKKGRNQEQSRKLPIKPMKPPKGKLIYIPISDLKMGYEKSLEFAEAVVAYFDVMGFRNKNDKEEIEATLFDFAAPLRETAKTYEELRFKIFSDCAFLAAPIEKIGDLMSAIRYAFEQWTFDGIFVRGGIATGTYSEYKDLIPQTKNFEWNFFAGSAVVKAVECERSGTGSLLHTTSDCAALLASKLKEPLFGLKKKIIVGWSDDDYVLYRYLGCSLLRLIRLLSNDNYDSEENKRVISNLITNIKYTLHATSPSLIWGCILAILSLPNLPTNARERTIKLLNINDPTDFERAKDFIEKFLQDKKEINYLLAHAELDSSINGSLM